MVWLSLAWGFLPPKLCRCGIQLGLRFKTPWVQLMNVLLFV